MKNSTSLLSIRNVFFAMAVAGASVALADVRVKPVSEKIAVDGKLVEAVWAEGWTGGLKQRKNDNPKTIRDTADYIVAADRATVYVAFRVHASDMARVKARQAGGMWSSDTVEFFFAPSGAPDDFYQFAVDYQQKRRYAQFYGEAGHITPDPYAPEWEIAVGDTADGWCVEAAIPLAAFYMTRNRDWKTDWLFNISFANRTMNEVTLVSGGLRGSSSKEFVRLADCPRRAAADDFAATELTAAFDAVDEAGKIGGTLTVKVFAGVAGTYAVSSQYVPHGQSVKLKAGDNTVKIRCVYPEQGRFVTDLAFTRQTDGRIFRRDYPVFVDFEPIMVSFTKPGYRRNFYPGQDASAVAGHVRIAGNAPATLTLEGPGFARQTVTPAADGSFRFDTKGFEKGEASLTVQTAKDTKRIRIRNLPSSGHWMTWVEDGRLVANGKPGFKCCLSAPGFMGGEALKERFDSDYFYCRRDLSAFVNIEPRRLIKGIEQREAVRDVKPCEELLRKFDEVIAANRDKDFTGYYLCDEPECRGVSPVYLQHCYEYIAEHDPYHIIRIPSRAAANYYRACDLAESHDYFNLYVDEDGHRDWRVSCAMIADRIARHAAAKTPDKVLGCYGTAFAYRWQSLRNDYPTFSEYVCGVFAGIVNGAKSMQAYAYHDFADRPSTYCGYQFVNASVAGLEDLLLSDGETLLRTKDVQCVRYAANGQSAFVLVNLTREPKQVSVPGLGGHYYEYRGTREFDLQPPTFDLQPLEVLVATSLKRGTDLPTRAAVAAKIDRLECERTHRDNQLLERYFDVDFETPGKFRAFSRTYKLIDGTRDVMAVTWKNGLANTLGLAFKNDFRPTFDTVRVHGFDVDGLAVDIRRDGDWVELKPLRRICDKYLCELQFAECVRPLRMRLRFVHPKGAKEPTEIYEIELPAPRVGVQTAPVAAPVTPPVAAPVTPPVAEPTVVTPLEKPFWTIEGLSLRTNSWSRHVRLDPTAYPWLVMDAAFRTIDPKVYSYWKIGTKKGTFGGAVKRFENGLYTLKVPTSAQPKDTLRFWFRNVAFDAPRIACEKHPVNFLSAGVVQGDSVRPGATVRVRLELAAPCEDVTAAFVRCGRHVAFGPVKVNGRSDIQLKATDQSHRVWEAAIAVKSCETAAPREVFVRANVLGGALKVPILTNFVEPFASGDASAAPSK